MTDKQFSPKITDDLTKMHEDYLAPIIFAPWAHHLTDIAAIESGHNVLDVACGTGVATRAALLEVGMVGTVTGLDHSEEMLAVSSASARSRGIKWQQGDAADLPFRDNSFDRVLCSFALMIISNRIAAIKEMLRVCKRGGRATVSIWAPLDRTKAYTALVKLTHQYAGARAASKLASPWSLGIPGKMDSLLLSAGVNEYECHERVGLARFPSVETFVEVHLRSAGEYHALDERKREDMFDAAKFALAPFIGPKGELTAELNANIFVINPD